MSCKNSVKARLFRIKLMRIFSFIPDKVMVCIQYRVKTGRKLNLKSPKRYTEKLQWYKLNYRDSVMGECADKYLVRKFVESQGFEHILTPIIGVYSNPAEIDFDELPNKFVLKDTLGGGGSSIIICENKEKLNVKNTIGTLKKWVEPKRGKHPGREWVYDKKKSKILIESYIDSNLRSGGLIDYKFFCFNGRVAFVYGIADRKLGKGVELGIYDREFNLLPYNRMDEKPLTRTIRKPLNYEDMVTCAEKLSSRFPHARIDLYDEKEKIRFGEITFFDGSGYMTFFPDEFDFKMGKEFAIGK